MGNRSYWNADENGFYEVWYFTINHRASGKAFWLRSTLLKTHEGQGRNGGLWIALFDPDNPSKNFAANQFFREDEVTVDQARFMVEIGSSLLREGEYRAEFMPGGHKVSWDLSWAPHEEDIWPVPSLIRASRIPKADVCVPNVDIKLFGSLSIDGETYKLDGDLAGQSHHWGRHMARQWLWGHCNDFASAPGSWLEVLSVQPFAIAGHGIPTTLLALETPSGRFSVRSATQLLSSRASYADCTWRFLAQDGPYRIEAQFSADPEHFVLFPYESPHSEAFWCHNSCLCDLTVKVFKHKPTGWEQIEQLHSKKRAAAEFCSMQNTSPEQFRTGNPKALRFH